MKLKNILFIYSSFTKKSGRLEYGGYLLFNIITFYIALDLYRTVNLNNETILHIFYTCLIVLLIFVPMQAVTARRLRDLNTNPTFLIFNFIPILNLAFIIFLLLAKRKNT